MRSQREEKEQYLGGAGQHSPGPREGVAGRGIFGAQPIASRAVRLRVDHHCPMPFDTLRAAFRSKRQMARHLSDAARAKLIHAPLVDSEGIYPRTTVVGIHPVRVLLFGSGPLIGYGVQQRAQAVDGPLAQLIADGLGRGVTVECRAGLRTDTRDAVKSLGGAGTATFRAAVWAPRFGEELARFKRARADFRGMLRQFREQSDIPLVVCELPIPVGSDWRTLLRRPRVVRYNHALAIEAGAIEGVAVVPAGVYEPATVATSLGPDWHRTLAAHIAPAILVVTAHLRSRGG